MQTHQGERNRIVARRKDDREVALDHREFVDGDRDGVRRCDAIEAGHATDLEVAVLVAIERLKAIVKKRQHVRRLARHEYNSEMGRTGGAGPIFAGLLKIARPPLVAALAKCKAFARAEISRVSVTVGWQFITAFNACR